MSGLVRIIGHWTAGSYTPNEQDKKHYHYIVNGDGLIIEGDYKPEANISTSDADGYAAHTRACNTGSIGISIAAMAGAIEMPFDPGKYPIKEIQWKAFVGKIAELCKKYNIKVTRETVLTHAEVQGTLGIQQAGKWDITRLPFVPGLVGATAVGDKLRTEVSYLLQPLNKGIAISPLVPPAPRFVTHDELAKLFRDFADELGRRN